MREEATEVGMVTLEGGIVIGDFFVGCSPSEEGLFWYVSAKKMNTAPLEGPITYYFNRDRGWQREVYKKEGRFLSKEAARAALTNVLRSGTTTMADAPRKAGVVPPKA